MVRYVCVHKYISLEACKIRADAINDDNHIIRRPSEDFHNHYIKTLPNAANQMYGRGILLDILDDMKLILRDGTVIWDSERKEDRLPGEVYYDYLNKMSVYEKMNKETRSKNIQNNIDAAKRNNIDELKHLKDELVSFVDTDDRIKRR